MIGSIEGHSHMVRETAHRRAAMFRNVAAGKDGETSGVELSAQSAGADSETNAILPMGDFVAELDKEGENSVSAEALEEMRGRPSWWVEDRPAMPAPHSRKMFDMLDADQDGGISETEMSDLIDRINEWSGKELDLSEVFGQADADGDGLVSKEELKSLRDVVGPPKWHGFGHRAMRSYPPEEATSQVEDPTLPQTETTSIEI